MNKPLNIVIADDNKFFCEALKDSLNQHKELYVLATYSNIEELIAYSNSNFGIDVLILDVNFNGQSSLDYIEEIKKKNSNFKIISLTTLNNNFIRQEAIEKGIDCFVGKDSDLLNFKTKIIDCYYSENKSTIIKSKIEIENLVFTKRKLEIIQALYKYSDKKEKELAAILNIAESSLKTHKRELFEITNTNSTPELIKFGIQKGLIIT